MQATGLENVHFSLKGNLTIHPDVAYWNTPGNTFNVCQSQPRTAAARTGILTSRYPS